MGWSKKKKKKTAFAAFAAFLQFIDSNIGSNWGWSFGDYWFPYSKEMFWALASGLLSPMRNQMDSAVLFKGYSYIRYKPLVKYMQILILKA